MVHSFGRRLSGRTLQALAFAARSTPAVYPIAARFRDELGINRLRRLDPALRGPIPNDQQPLVARSPRIWDQPLPALGSAPVPTISSYTTAYTRRETTPSEVVRRIYAVATELARHPNRLDALLYRTETSALRDAAESELRLAEGRPRSALEGVPVVIKEEVNVAGVPTRLGTGFIPELPASADALSVARLRGAGAIIVGTTPMTEYGLSPLGGNIHRRMPRNVHNPSHLAGGSSTGAAVAVGVGLAPLALAADGGGSIRIPAAFNGIFGLKPTFGRIPLTGHGLSCGSTVVHLGPLANSTDDLAVLVDVTANLETSLQSSSRRGVRGLRVGVDAREWSAAHPDVARGCEAALAELVRDGATLVDVQLGLAPHVGAIGYLTFGVEAYVALEEARLHHAAELGPDVQLLMACVRTLGAEEYLEAQRFRSALRAQCRTLLAGVDVLAFPTTARTAPSISDAEDRGGFIDPSALDAACRYAFLANLTGLPAGSAPVGHASNGLPIGLQIVGDAWDEASVLQVMGHLERLEVARVKPGPVYASGLS